MNIFKKLMDAINQNRHNRRTPRYLDIEPYWFESPDSLGKRIELIAEYRRHEMYEEYKNSDMSKALNAFFGNVGDAINDVREFTISADYQTVIHFDTHHDFYQNSNPFRDQMVFPKLGDLGNVILFGKQVECDDDVPFGFFMVDGTLVSAAPFFEAVETYKAANHEND